MEGSERGGFLSAVIPVRRTQQVPIVDSRCGTYGRVLFKANASYILCGRSGSGKTTAIYKWLKAADAMFERSGRRMRVLYCYRQGQDLFDDIKRDVSDVTFHEGMMDEETMISQHSDAGRAHLVIVLDDLMREVVSSEEVCDFFTVKCHHQSCSVLFVTHNLFQQGKFARAITLNASYIILFENPRGADQLRMLERQVFPGEPGAIVDAFALATSKSDFAYLVVDLTPGVPRSLRVRSHVLPDEMMTFYFARKSVSRDVAHVSGPNG